MVVADSKKVPEETGRGFTGRFVPCPATPWRHPEERRAFEVRWSTKVKRGDRRVYFFFTCTCCTPNSTIFLNDWTENSGFTLVEAEAAGFRPKVNRERREELLKELGLRQIAGPQQIPPVPAPWPPMHPLPRVPQVPPGYAPYKKPSKKKKKA